jgi:hypothetical protein
VQFDVTQHLEKRHVIYELSNQHLPFSKPYLQDLAAEAAHENAQRHWTTSSCHGMATG